jgi:hypothetical protein
MENAYCPVISIEHANSFAESINDVHAFPAIALLAVRTPYRAFREPSHQGGKPS